MSCVVTVKVILNYSVNLMVGKTVLPSVGPGFGFQTEKIVIRFFFRFQPGVWKLIVYHRWSAPSSSPIASDCRPFGL